jgi:hypothetical protein
MRRGNAGGYGKYGRKEIKKQGRRSDEKVWKPKKGSWVDLHGSPSRSGAIWQKEECGFNYTINQGIFMFPRGVSCGRLLRLTKAINGEIFLI